MLSSSNPPEPGDVTRLLHRVATGERSAESELYAIVEAELRSLATRRLSREPGHTLQVTALVHEAWAKLLLPGHTPASDREHFLAVAAQAVRNVLVDHERRRRAAKRGGNHTRVPLEDVLSVFDERASDLIDLHTALERLAEVVPRQARIVELRFFGGLDIDQAARVLGTSPATVKREWHLARMWLRAQLC